MVKLCSTFSNYTDMIIVINKDWVNKGLLSISHSLIQLNNPQIVSSWHWWKYSLFWYKQIRSVTLFLFIYFAKTHAFKLGLFSMVCLEKSTKLKVCNLCRCFGVYFTKSIYIYISKHGNVWKIKVRKKKHIFVHLHENYCKQNILHFYTV
jgi:hypothetical protein